MIEDTVADAHSPYHYVESGATNAVGISSPSRSLPVRVAERARIVLFAAFGQQDKEIAAVMAITPKKVSRWRKRFLALGVAGLAKDAPRPGRKPKIGARLTKRVVTMTTRQQPTNATHWSTRTMAAAVGISEAS